MKVLSDSFSEEMVDIYDSYFLGEEKCQSEARLIMESEFGSLTSSKEVLLDVGCGTGAYSEVFADYFDVVIGVDRSADMISYAMNNHKKSNIEYRCLDAGCKKPYSQQKGDAAIALAHVIGYQLSNASVMSFLETINMNLKKQGLLLFSFYNQPAIYLNKLQPRCIKRVGSEHDVIRVSNARVVPSESCLALDYYYILEGSNEKEVIEIHEKMRFFSTQEVDFFLNQAGFEVISFFSYENRQDLGSDDWNGGCLARKI